MKKTSFYYTVIILMFSFLYSGTVNYYDGSGGYINKPLDNVFVGDDPTIAS